MKARAHVVVTGRVQGVFFRAETASKARRYNVKGWVRNLSDGRVEAMFEGEKENVEKMIAYCREGPPAAYVTNVDLKWEDFKGEFNEFRVTG
jgi:acylphosphatase